MTNTKIKQHIKDNSTLLCSNGMFEHRVKNGTQFILVNYKIGFNIFYNKPDNDLQAELKRFNSL